MEYVYNDLAEDIDYSIDYIEVVLFLDRAQPDGSRKEGRIFLVIYFNKVASYRETSTAPPSPPPKKPFWLKLTTPVNFPISCSCAHVSSS